MTTVYKSHAGAMAIRQQYDAALGAWPVPSEQTRIATAAGETFVVSSGPNDAPPVILLHGSGANATTWLSDVAAWSQKFRVHAVDMLGEPGRSAEVRLALDSDDTAAWLDDVLEALGITDTALVGMSLGGWTALDYTIRRPTRVTRVVLLCPGGIGRQKYGWLPKALLMGAFGKQGRRRMARQVTGLHDAEYRAILDQVALTFAHFRPRTEKLPIFDDSALHSVSAPMLAIVGDRDVLMNSAETTERVRRCIPRARVTVLPGTGHAVLGQTEAIAQFLAG